MTHGYCAISASSSGRSAGAASFYSMYDQHVAALIDQAVGHVEHLRLGAVAPPSVAASES
jgi:hypothetical protein